MVSVKHIFSAASMILLAGCDSGSKPTEVKKIAVGDSGAYAAKLRALSEQDRSLTLRRAVLDAGQACRRVQGSAEIGTYQNLSMWTVRCDEDHDWAVFIAGTGDTQVRSCGHVERLGLPTCDAKDSPPAAKS